MADRPNNPVEDEFQDPLENYEPPAYEDPLEGALGEEKVSAIRSKPLARVSPDTTVEVALQQLVREHIACLLVEDDGKLVGVFSDRDLLNKVALEYDEMKHQPVKEVMTDNPVYIYETESAAAALSVMAITGYRHVPVVDDRENLIGIVSPQRVVQFLRDHLEKN